MRIFLIIIFIFAGTAQCAVPAYGLQPSESEYLEEFNSEEKTEISKEKENIMESIAPAREERERNLHPFVEGGEPAELQTQDFSSTGSPSRAKPRPFFGKGWTKSRDKPGYVEGVDYAARVNAPVEPEIEAPLINAPAPNLKHNAGINFLFILIILAAFLLAHFFIQPKSK